MSSLLWSALAAGPAVLGASFFIVDSTFAAQISNNIEPVPIQVATAFSEDSSPSEKSTVVLLTQELGTEVEKFQFSERVSSEPSLPKKFAGERGSGGAGEQEFFPSKTVARHSWNAPKELANKSSDEPLFIAELTTDEPTSEVLEPINGDSSLEEADDPMGQVTNVTQLSDVSPGDWAYEALRSLVERYGCIAGYPDGTFRGNRAMTRYEFAAGLNACLQQVERLIASATSEFVRREDLETMQRMVQEFQTELATLGTRVDTLEGRVAFLEDHQFSVTTKLTGSADFGLIDAWGDRKAVPSGQQPTEDLNVNTIFPGRVGLNFDSSFTGEDLLRVKLESGNFTPLDASVTGTDMTLYDFDTRTGPTGNDVILGSLSYRFPVGDRVEVVVAPQGLGSPDVAPQLNPAGGGLSRFGQRNPIYRLSDGAGIGVNVKLSEAFLASFTYLGNPGNFSNPGLERGMFDGQFGALAQLTVTPFQNLDLAFTYVRYYSPQPGEGINLTGNTGSGFAQTPFGDDVATTGNAYGIEAQYRFTPRFAIGGWVGVTKAEAETSGILPNGALVNAGDDAEVWNYAVAMAFRDFIREGNALGFIFGMPPRIRGNDVVSRRDLDTSYRVEAFYRHKLTNNIFITPSFFMVFNPEHNNANDTIYVGTLLTTFSF
ncbi:MAG: iron uptake porin [Cyanobacteriota bacterium]